MDQFSQDIPIGSRGKLHGVEWEVRGLIVKAYSPTILWKEYLLYNEKKGERWLTEIDGHWNYVVALHRSPRKIDSLHYSYLNQNFRLFHHSHGVVKHFAGDFDWEISEGDTTNYDEYVCPPHILTHEQPTGELSTWYLGEYVDAETVRTAFKCDASEFPTKVGVSPNQPCPHKARQNPAFKVAGAFALFLILFYSLLTLICIPSAPLNTALKIVSPHSEFVSEPFALSHRLGQVEVQIKAPHLYNQAIETEIALVNIETGNAYALATGVEYYQGYSDGEYWSEGSKKTAVVLPSIPSGN